MALPEILEPGSMPPWLASPHDIEETPLYGDADMSTGHSRRRRLYTASTRTLRAARYLTEAQLTDWHNWHEGVLQAGLQRFSTQVANFGPGTVWFDAQVLRYTSAPAEGGEGYSELTAELLLRGNPSTEAPVATGASDLTTALLESGAYIEPSAQASDLTVAALESGAAVATASNASTDMTTIGLESEAVATSAPTMSGSDLSVVALESGSVATTTGGAVVAGKYHVGGSWSGVGDAITVPAHDVAVVAHTSGTITAVTVVTQGGTGSCVIDVWRDLYSAYPATVADSITASVKPTIASGTKYRDVTLTGWDTTVTAGDAFVLHLESSSVFTAISIFIEVTP